MNKKVFIFLILALMIFAFGCKTTGTKTSTSNGLDISFISDEPPEKVADADQETFKITLNLKNKGEFTIPKGKVIATLSGIPKDAFSLSSLDAVSKTSIEGVTKEDNKEIEGAEEELSFGDARYKEDLKLDFTYPIQADACYLYETDALASLCLKKNPLEKEKETQACEISLNLGVENSKAPLQITNVNQKGVGSNEVRVMFDIEKKGSGDVYENDAFTSTCSGQDDKKNKVKVSVITREQKNLDIKCSAIDDKSEGVIRLIDGKKTISCRIKTDNLQQSAFSTPLEINLAYFFRETLSKSLTVENSGE